MIVYIRFYDENHKFFGLSAYGSIKDARKRLHDMGYEYAPHCTDCDYCKTDGWKPVYASICVTVKYEEE